ncbi:hypothetical protein FA15DRAFT_672046 [Coprinopsis marcescibilis]|uniref:Uncharacterized protein n=1 Tax=Coprinopsis marcescibilis TaxID=230819 RepID=A0A5C3KN62_COPMA|nr:hypothetical protein FA15DRAFT_672046 [Coprinopsis marcescibilis]
MAQISKVRYITGTSVLQDASLVPTMVRNPYDGNRETSVRSLGLKGPLSGQQGHGEGKYRPRGHSAKALFARYYMTLSGNK